jgi:hypothetical protein
MPESKLHRFLKQEILPDSFLYRNLGVWFKRRVDEKLGHTMHRPDIYCYCPKGMVIKNVLLLGEVETGGGNYWWNLQQTEPILGQQWATNTILFQVFFPTCREDWIDTSIKEGRRLERKYRRVHFYAFEMKIDEERAYRLSHSFRRGRKKENDMRVLRREINKINKSLLVIVKKYLVF